jgi:cbb3-type cytochrome oxidase maturation protein
MNMIFVSIPIGIVLLGLGVWAFFWAVRSGQYDDLESPAYSILDDGKPERAAESEPTPTDHEPGDRT